MHAQYAELSNVDVSGDPTGSSALAMAPRNAKKGFTTASSPTVPISTAALLNFSCYYTLLPIQLPLSLTSLKARVCPRRTSSVLEAAEEVVNREGKAALAPLFPACPFPFVLPSSPTAPLRLQTGDSFASPGDWAGQTEGYPARGPPRAVRAHRGDSLPDSPRSWAGAHSPPQPGPRAGFQREPEAQGTGT